MKTENLIPFNLDIALKHPERVRFIQGTKARRVIHIPEADTLFQVVVVWETGIVDTYTVDGHPDGTRSSVLFLTEETKVVPWESIDEVPEGVYFRNKDARNVIRIINGYSLLEQKVLINSAWISLIELLPYWEFSPNRNGPWMPCGKAVAG